MMVAVPKIEASSVKEHRALMTSKLVDAAEALLVSDDVDALTVGAVASAVGIARNSVYRYIGSIDELRGRVVARRLPGWVEAVEQAVAKANGARAKLLAYVTSNLEQAHSSGHGRLIRLAHGLDSEALEEIAGIHQRLSSMLLEYCRALDAEGFVMTGAFVQALLEVGFARLDAGDALPVVRERCIAAVSAIVFGREGQ